MGEKALRVRIHGQVQGVGYRAWTARQARALGLRGWVRNRADGTVEAAFAGAPAGVDEMVRRCARGPALARVSRLDSEPDPDPAPASFEQRPSL